MDLAFFKLFQAERGRRRGHRRHDCQPKEEDIGQGHVRRRQRHRTAAAMTRGEKVMSGTDLVVKVKFNNKVWITNWICFAMLPYVTSSPYYSTSMHIIMLVGVTDVLMPSLCFILLLIRNFCVTIIVLDSTLLCPPTAGCMLP